jgi:putative spermidine/putrescine transport system ATP-binding protein
MLAGLINPDAGTITLDGADITHQPAHVRNMGYVFQSYALFPHMNVATNVGFGLRERGIAWAEADARIKEALAMVRLGGLELRRPRELSGGQQQRVALARALVIRPSVLLLDESLSNLDAKLRDAMRHEIRDIQRSLDITTLFVTHDQVEALTMCDRIAVMNRGRIVQIGSPVEIYERPATRFVAEFVGRTNVLATTRDNVGRIFLWGTPLHGAASSGDALDVFIRPQRIRLLPLSETTGEGVIRVPGRVVRSVFVGDQIEVIVKGTGGQLSVQMASGQPLLEEGSEVAAIWRAEDMRFFPREGP